MVTDAINPTRGILCKLASVAVFVMMQTCIKAAGSGIPAGQITFFRSAFGMVPILFYLAVLGELKGAFHTNSKFSHVRRGIIGILGMAFGFYGLTKLPMPDAIAIGYSAPLIAVIFAALFLKERVGIYRWSAVIVGMIGVLIITWPKLTMFDAGGMGSQQAIGAIAVILGAIMSGLAMLQTRQLVRTEKSATIVLYLSLSGSFFALLTFPFGWVALGWQESLLLIGAGIFGGLGQILITEAYRNADASTIAPLDYTSIWFGIAIAYVLFGDVPTFTMLFGTAITALAGIFIIFREHWLGLERKAARKVSPPGD
jgi:drug/metabolite transporter (DMT)-like permease